MMPKNKISTECEYWVKGSNGTGYCSAYSMGDALKEFHQENKRCKNVHGDLVEQYVIKRTFYEKVERSEWKK